MNINTEQEMARLGAELANLLQSPFLIYLHGDLGVGKTTLTRSILHALGHEGPVKSPTYTLVESYALVDILCYHFDFYRVNDPEELEYMGIRDYLAQNAILIIEWPEKGGAMLPTPDIGIDIIYGQVGRVIDIKAHSKQGKALLEKLKGV